MNPFFSFLSEKSIWSKEEKQHMVKSVHECINWPHRHQFNNKHIQNRFF